MLATASITPPSPPSLAASTAASCQRHFAAEEGGGGSESMLSTLGSGGGKPAGGGWGFLMVPEHQDPIRTREAKGSGTGRQQRVPERRREDACLLCSQVCPWFVWGCCGEPCDGRRPPPVSKKTFGEEAVKARALLPRVMGHGQNTPHRCATFDPPLPGADAFFPRCPPHGLRRLMFYRPSLHGGKLASSNFA